MIHGRHAAHEYLWSPALLPLFGDTSAAKVDFNVSAMNFAMPHFPVLICNPVKHKKFISDNRLCLLCAKLLTLYYPNYPVTLQVRGKLTGSDLLFDPRVAAALKVLDVRA